MCRKSKAVFGTGLYSSQASYVHGRQLHMWSGIREVAYLSCDLAEVVVQEAGRMSLLMRQIIATLRGLKMRANTGDL
jgi:hypothetical protein